MKYKCCTCRKPLDNPHKLLSHGRDDLNKYTSRRKPVAWCKECWDEFEKFNEESKRKAEEENEKLIELYFGVNKL